MNRLQEDRGLRGTDPYAGCFAQRPMFTDTVLCIRSSRRVDSEFFKLENALGEFRGFKEKMAADKEPVIRKGLFQVPEGPGLGLQLNEDWLKQHVAKRDTYWG